METPPLDSQVMLDHAEWIRRFARSLVRDTHVADDLVQDTWLAALRSRPDDDRPLRPWLARVLRNFAIQRNRRERSAPIDRLDPSDDEHSANDLPSPEELYDRAEQSARLVKAVMQLGEPFRSTLLLRYHEGLSAAEIARKKGLPPATVRSRLKRGLDLVRAQLDQESGGREAWVMAILPLLGEGGIPQGALAMKVSTKIAAGVGIAVLVGAGSFPFWNPAAANEAALEVARTPAELVAPDLEEPSVKGVEEVLEAPRESVAAAAPVSKSTPKVVDQAAFSGRLLDSVTGEPIPSYSLRVQQAEQDLTLVTDANGLFESDVLFETGSLELHWIDDPGVRRYSSEAKPGSDSISTNGSKEHRSFDVDAPSMGDLAIEIGPTYRLEIAGPVDLDPSELIAALIPEDAWVDFVRQTTSTPVREGDVEWVRFGPLEKGLLPNQAPWRLEVRSLDGLLRGVGEVNSIVGIAPDRVRIELSECGVLKGRILEADGSGSEGALVRIEGNGVSRTDKTDAEGLYRIDWIQPGSVELTVRKHSDRDVAESILVESGIETEFNATLQPVASAGSIRGTLTSRSGGYKSGVLILLSPVDADVRTHQSSPEWAEVDGRMVANFAFEDLPDVEYTLSLLSFADQFEWTPSTIVVRAPAERIELVCEDDGATIDLVIRLRDETTGETIPEFTLDYSANNGLLQGIGGRKSGEVAVDRLPEGGALSFIVRAEGYAPAFGDLDDFSAVKGGVRELELSLRAGFAQRFRVRDAVGAPQIDIAVLYDGVEVGRTNADGVALIYSATEPVAVEISKLGWHVSDGDPADAAAGERALYHEIVLSPDE